MFPWKYHPLPLSSYSQHPLDLIRCTSLIPIRYNHHHSLYLTCYTCMAPHPFHVTRYISMQHHPLHVTTRCTLTGALHAFQTATSTITITSHVLRVCPRPMTPHRLRITRYTSPLYFRAISSVTYHRPLHLDRCIWQYQTATTHTRYTSRVCTSHSTVTNHHPVTQQHHKPLHLTGYLSNVTPHPLHIIHYIPPAAHRPLHDARDAVNPTVRYGFHVTSYHPLHLIRYTWPATNRYIPPCNFPLLRLIATRFINAFTGHSH